MNIFAEIEMDFTGDKVGSALIPSRSIKKIDPIREKFYDMRSLANNNPDTWHDSKLFYRQAKFMENFEDDYELSKEFSMYSPCYQKLGYQELRTYFTWRKKIRAGEVAPSSLSMVFLYVYELLANIGAGSLQDGLVKLMWVWNNYKDTFTALNDYLPNWLKDYHIYYNLPHTFNEFVSSNNLKSYYSKLFLYSPQSFEDENLLENWLVFSSYDILKSKFYKSGNKELLTDCFRYILYKFNDLCNGSLVELFTYKYTTHGWRVFRRGNFYPWYRQNNKKIEMPDGQVYICTNNNWQVESRSPYTFHNNLVGYILKAMESCLRKVTGYKTNITANKAVLIRAEDSLIHKGISYKNIIDTINNGVAEFYKEKTKIVVNVSTENLMEIRIAANKTQEKLIVEENLSEKIVTEEIATKGISETPPDITQGTTTSSIWQELKQALEQQEIQAIVAMLKNEQKLAVYAKSISIMPEVLADSINEKAMDIIGDNILDEELIIYEDYVPDLMEMIT